MDSITQSPDRVAQVLSGSAVQNGAGDSAAADSNPVQVVEQAVTGVSAAEFVYESSRQQHSSVSEGVASAGHPPQVAVDRMDEFVPTSAFDAPGAAPGGCEGETSGGNDIADGSNGYGELADTGAAPSFAAAAPFLGSPMDYQATGSVLNGGGTHAGKRKSCGDGSSEFLEPKRPEGGLNRVPSDLAMVMGLSDGEGAEPVEAPRRQPEAPCDSNIAGILAGVAAAPTVGDVEIVQAGEFTDGVGGGGAEPARPSDADIIAWENQIREDEVRNVPLVGDREPLAALEAEYINGSHVFVSKIRTLQQGYSSIRRTRGDGNCFFRSFIFAYLEHILLSGDLAERDAAVGRLAGLQKGLQEAGFDELVVESPMDMLLSMLRSIGSPTDPLTLDVLESNMRAEDVSNYVVFLLRIITSAEVKRRADFFAPFVLVSCHFTACACHVHYPHVSCLHSAVKISS